MDLLSYPIEELIPHRGTMRLIDRLVAFDEKEHCVVCEFIVRNKFSRSHVAIEYMAQASAVLAGLFDKIENPDLPPRIGFLMGSRKLKLDIENFHVGKAYQVKVKELFSDDNMGSFEAGIYDSGKEVASAILNAFRP